MKKVFFFLLMSTVFSVFAKAQESEPKAKQGTENNRHMKKKLKDDLNLSKEQSDQMKEINSGYKTKMQEIKNNESLSADQKKEQIKVLHKERNTKTKTILTAEQQNKMKKAVNNRRHKKDRTPV